MYTHGSKFRRDMHVCSEKYNPAISCSLGTTLLPGWECQWGLCAACVCLSLYSLHMNKAVQVYGEESKYPYTYVFAQRI